MIATVGNPPSPMSRGKQRACYTSDTLLIWQNEASLTGSATRLRPSASRHSESKECLSEKKTPHFKHESREQVAFFTQD